jgi:hypothetical protein
MNNDLSLATILNSTDDSFIRRMAKKKQEVEKDKAGLLSAASEYSKKYQKEVNEGTEKRKILIENGKRQGLSPEETLKNMAVFIPDKNTPILNMLYFLLHEYDGASEAVQFLREEKDRSVNYNQLKDNLNEKFGGLSMEDIEQDIPEILEYVYENVTSEIFKKVKKLKTLATSKPTTPEQYAAFGKAMELCHKYNLEYDKLPAYTDK